MARITRGNPLTPGMKRFSEEQMRSLYGSREQYEQQVNAKLDDMVRNRWVLPQGRSADVLAADLGLSMTSHASHCMRTDRGPRSTAP